MPQKKTKKEEGNYNRIKAVLEEKEKTQVWLAEQLNVEFVTVSRYVNNRNQPTLARLFDIARVLKVSPRDLLEC